MFDTALALRDSEGMIRGEIAMKTDGKVAAVRFSFESDHAFGEVSEPWEWIFRSIHLMNLKEVQRNLGL